MTEENKAAKQESPKAPAAAEVKSNEAVKSSEQVELERLTLEEKRLAVEFQRAQLEDMRERLDERGLKRDTFRQRSLTNGQTLKQLKSNDEAVQKRCNHHKGGNGMGGYLGGQGDDPQYAVIKHKVSNSDLWIRCMRCGKTWKPPIASEYETPEALTKAQSEYQEAVNFPTRNVTSSSVVFQFSDGGKFFREQTKDVTLR
jgi:hypothetical protein